MHPFTYRLRKMIRSGVEPEIEIYPHTSDERAYLAEAQLIAKYGRKDQGKGPLLNMTDGRDGQRGMATATKAKISESLKRWFAPRAKIKIKKAPALTHDQVLDIRQRRAAGEKCGALAKEYGVSHALVSHICNGKRYKNV